MRAITPEARAVLRWFDRTHEVTGNGGGAAWWRLHTLPEDRGAGDQDARLMAALDWARGIENQLLREQRERDQAETVDTTRPRRTRR